MTASNRLFDLKDIACQRGGCILFQKLSFGMDGGDVVHLSGPNGSGKTSLLRIMAGALPCEGHIEWEGVGFLENGVEAHTARFAFLPSDDHSLKALETVDENMSFWASLWQVEEAQTKKDAALAALDIQSLKSTAIRYLSAGQKRRVSLARVLLKGSLLWLLDEPLNGLDDAAVVLFTKALDAHITAGGMVAVASHNEIDPPQHGNLRRVTLRGAV